MHTQRLGFDWHWFLSAAVLTLLGAGSALAAADTADHTKREQLARVRVPFVENRGQLDKRVAYSAPTFFGTVFVTRDGKLVYSLPKDRSAGWTLTETLVAGKPHPTAGPRAATGVSYFHGNDPKRWQSDLPTYDEVHLGEVWRGVSVSLRAHGGNVEKIFTLLPGVRVEKIRMRVDGATSLRTIEKGRSSPERTTAISASLHRRPTRREKEYAIRSLRPTS